MPSRRRLNHLPIAATALIVLATALLVTAPGSSAATSRPVKVMTQNLYLGSDLVPVLTATTLPQLLAGAATVYRQVQANDFPSRARALAAEIRDADPLVIGVQEASRWFVGDPGVLDGPATQATKVTYDYLALLIAELDRVGMPFVPLQIRVEFDAEVPTALGYDVRLEQRDAILVRSGLPGDELRILGSAQGDYVANDPIRVGGVTVPVHRGWSSVDLAANRRTLRIVNTHLEPTDATLRLAQAQELVAAGGPTDTSSPVAMVGDLNSGPAPADPAAYDAIIGAGFRDGWAEVSAEQEGFTCCQAADLRNPASQLNRRIDVVLFDSGTASQARRYGFAPADRTPAGLWPSDHAGVAIKLVP